LEKLGFTSVLSLVPLVYLLLFQVQLAPSACSWACSIPAYSRHLRIGHACFRSQTHASPSPADSASIVQWSGITRQLLSRRRRQQRHIRLSPHCSFCLQQPTRSVWRAFTPPSVPFVFASTHRIFPALFPIYSDLRGVPDLLDTKSDIIAAHSDAAPISAEAQTSGRRSDHTELDESSDDVEQAQAHAVTADTVAAVSVADAGHALEMHEMDSSHDEKSMELSLSSPSTSAAQLQDSHQNMKDMKLIVRVSLVRHVLPTMSFLATQLFAELLFIFSR
jgi:hypothetical protein